MPRRELTEEQKEARKQYHREYRKKHKEQIEAKRKEWYKNNPNYRAEQSRKRRKDHSDEISEYRKERRKNNLKHYRKLEKQSRERSPRNYISWKWSQTKAKRTKRGKVLEKGVDIEYLMDLWEKQGGKCAITDKQMLHESRSLYSVSIDRINSNLGYVENNIQLVCKAINLGKSDHTNKEMKEFWENRD